MKFVILALVVGLCFAEEESKKRPGLKAFLQQLSRDKFLKPYINGHLEKFGPAAHNSQFRQRSATPLTICNGGPSETVPTSVHMLRPGDIRVVGAIGDSTTAGAAARGSLFTALLDYRGLAFSIGGDQSLASGVVTLPNILREFSPGLRGFSSGIGTLFSRLNVAERDTDTRDLMEQTQELVALMKADGSINFMEDWKLITIFTGTNELCDCREDHVSESMFKMRMEEALVFLYNNLPRAFVQVIALIDISPLAELDGFLCPFIHQAFCPCVLDSTDRVTRLTRLFNMQLDEISSNSQLLDREDFTVVYQPFFEKSDSARERDGTIDESFYSPDCLHLRENGQQVLAINLWNNMFEPVGEKTTMINWDPNAPINCPGQNDFLRTFKNSQEHVGGARAVKPDSSRPDGQGGDGPDSSRPDGQDSDGSKGRRESEEQ